MRIAKFGLYLAGFMAVVNISVIYMALPSIERARTPELPTRNGF